MLQRPKVRFKLNDSFIEQYAGKQPNWGPLGYLTYKRTYSRPVCGACGSYNLDIDTSESYRCIECKSETSTTEEWWQTCKRVVEGVYNVQKAHCEALKLPWNNTKAQNSAQDMYQRMFLFKWTPPGRGLWAMGTEIVWTTSAPLFNCSCVTTAEIKDNLSEPFCYLMDSSMLGIGVGFDTRGAGTVLIKPPKISKEAQVIEDSREGWIDSVRSILDALSGRRLMPSGFDYSKIRAKGMPIKTFGGIAPGAEPLIDCHISLLKLFYNGSIDIQRNGSEITISAESTFEPYHITSTQIVDTFNLIGKCVVSGGVRRTAELAIGDHTDQEFISLKQDKVKLEDYRWSSNNSVFAEVGMNYDDLAKLAADNGEPGFLYLDNARKFGRTIDGPNYKDNRVVGYNPCIKFDQPVLTQDRGLVAVQDVLEGLDSIWTGEKWSKVVKKWDNGIQECYAYKTNAGVFSGTKEHKIVSLGEKTPVQHATMIDSVVGPVYKAGTINDGDVVDGIAFGMAKIVNNKPIISTLIYNFQDLWKVILKENVDTEITSPVLNSYVVKTSLTADDLVNYSDRNVPDRFYLGSLDKTVGFLRGLFSAKGTLAKTSGILNLKLYNEDGARRVQTMLSALGIGSFIKKGRFHSKETYNIRISYDLEKFARVIGLVSVGQSLNLIDIVNSRVKEFGDSASPTLTSNSITEVIDLGKHRVYDLMVEDEKHVLWNCGLLVSNCTEIALESQEYCNVPESFPSLHESLEDYLRTLKCSYLYGKTVSLMPSHNERTNSVQMRNRRIGLSQSGIIQNINRIGFREHMRWCDEGYKYIKALDEIYSEWLCIPKSIKKTSIKPSGSVSLLPGVTPGIHYPHSEYYIRNIRIADTSPLVKACKRAGYAVEPDTYAPNTLVVSFPVKEEHFVKAKKDVSIWEQMEIAAQIQAYWADNGVSCTVTVKEEEKPLIGKALEMYETRIKGISFLPLKDHGYKQAPYIEITKEEYEKLAKKIKPLDLSNAEHEKTEAFCTNDSCELPWAKTADESS